MIALRDVSNPQEKRKANWTATEDPNDRPQADSLAETEDEKRSLRAPAIWDQSIRKMRCIDCTTELA
jgi:hypothetical protein